MVQSKNKTRGLALLAGVLIVVCLLRLPLKAQDWEVVEFPLPESITGCCFINADTGHLVTAGGKHARTFDGGKLWWGRQITADIPLEDASFINGMVGFVCGRRGQIHFTLDGGDKWHDVSWPDTAATFVSITMIDRQIILASGILKTKDNQSGGIMIRSTNGGKDWTKIDLLGNAIGDIFYTPERGIFVLSLGGFHYSGDSGATWKSQEFTGQPGRTLAVSGPNGIMVGNFGLVNFSFDSAKTWLKSSFDNLQCQLTCVVMVDDTLAYIGGSDGAIYRSVDGGKNWTGELLAKSFHVLDLAVTGDWLWAVGGNGGIIRKNIR